MREILFRGRTIKFREWYEGELINTTGKIPPYMPMIFQPSENSDGEVFDVDPDTVGQYTGLTDDDGRRIFEGDIVSGLFRFGMKKNALVTFKDGAFGLEWYGGGIAHFDAFTSICNVKYHVLSNVYDNPELLFKED